MVEQFVFTRDHLDTGDEGGAKIYTQWGWRKGWNNKLCSSFFALYGSLVYGYYRIMRVFTYAVDSFFVWHFINERSICHTCNFFSFFFFYSAVPAFLNKMRVSSGINAQMSHSWSKLWLQVNQKNLEVFFDKGWRGRYPTENTFKNIFHNTVSHSIHVTDVYFNSTSHIFLFFWITHFHRIQRAPEEPLHF